MCENCCERQVGDMDFPLIYCNGDSYSAENYHGILHGKTYANIVGSHCNAFVVNRSVSGSCNRRIVRSSLHDLVLQRQLNPNQKIIALIGLSFELRTELWVDELNISGVPSESNFVNHHFTKQISWRQNLLAGRSIETENHYKLETVFLDKFSQGRAFFYSPYAERINLLTDLVMLKSTLDLMKVDFLIFQSPKAEQLQSEYLVDFLKQQLTMDDRFFDLEQFGFCDWCHESGFQPLDFLDRPRIGHYGPDAHRAFAEQILIPRLEKLNIL